MIEPTDEMVRAFTRHFFTCFRDADVRDALAAVLAIVERDRCMDVRDHVWGPSRPGNTICGADGPDGLRCERASHTPDSMHGYVGAGELVLW